jgi:glycerophosphoryl diester phosphodiesterase
MTTPVIVGHRGAGVLAPENTLAAIRRGVALGVGAIEIDVQRTRDGQLVVHHDDTLARTTGVARPVDELDLEELQQLDAGRWFAAEFTGERVPTLEQVAAALPADVHLVADFKHGDERWPGLSGQIADFARAFGPSRLAVISIRHEFAARVAAAVPGVLALFVYRAPLATDAELRALRGLPPGVGIGASLRALSAGLLVAAREDRRRVYTFTPNSETELSVALRVGADALITDRPDLALDLRRRLASDGARRP